MTHSVTPGVLYEQDFALWIDDTVAKLKARNFEQIDLENLIEEIESLGRSEKRELENRLDVLFQHILKRVYVNSPNDYRGWRDTITEQRRQLKRLLKQSPSLKNYFETSSTKFIRTLYRSFVSNMKRLNFQVTGSLAARLIRF